MQHIDWKKEVKINPFFFKKRFKKLWVMVINDDRFLRHREFHTRMSALAYAERNDIQDFLLHKRDRRRIKKIYEDLHKEIPETEKPLKRESLPQVNPFGETINCVQCGRDTTSKHGYCTRCNPNSRFKPEQINDRKDRKVLPIII